VQTLATIGYQGTTIPAFLVALEEAGIEIVVDIRAVSSSRRPGFSKSALAAHLSTQNIDYLHLRGLGTPAEGRAAARAGRHDRLRRIYAAHLRTAGARAELDVLVELVRSGRRACLLCFEADAAHCHRSLVAAAVLARTPIDVVHLTPHLHNSHGSL
jgi:uncharacterized protein (DUF488 family)